MEEAENGNKEREMQGQKGQAATGALIFVMVLILIVLFFLV